ncbi:choice-of-anchor Q domain-containing protein [Desulfocurvibacter africanus]|uniref:choice-of-anchor Q domain-containing protein n=1 Tax=Desulfocurvibacter africanus TaxID=873 RepID=UPI002FDB611A
MIASSAGAATWYVSTVDNGIFTGDSWSSSFRSIQDAVDAAHDGDSIWIRSGVYQIELPIRVDKAVVVIGGFSGIEGHPNERASDTYSTVDAGGEGTGIKITANARIERLIIQNANTEVLDLTWEPHMAKYLPGAGIYAENCSLTIHDRIIQDCIGDEDGGGSIRAKNCDLDMNSCRILRCRGGGMWGRALGGPYLESCTGDVENVLVDDCIGGPRVEEGSVVFNRCTFSNTSGSRTSEPVVYFAGEHRISDSKFVRNTSVGTVCQFIGLIIERSLFDGNGGSGWGVMAESSSFTNCVFTASSLNIDSSRLVNCTLGAHSFTGTGNSTIANCIIWSADSQTGPGVQIDLGTIIAHSLIYGGFEGEGNLDADPLFVDPASSNYRLQLESPCIDAGTEDIDDLPKTDIDGVRRVIGSAPDMGAYEHFGFPLGSLCPLILSGI